MHDVRNNTDLARAKLLPVLHGTPSILHGIVPVGKGRLWAVSEGNPKVANNVHELLPAGERVNLVLDRTPSQLPYPCTCAGGKVSLVGLKVEHLQSLHSLSCTCW
jgi:hypothetical protein